MKHIVGAFALLLLMACASPHSIGDKSAAMARVENLTNITPMMEIFSLQPERFSKVELEAKEADIYQKAEKVCSDPISQRIGKLLDNIQYTHDSFLNTALAIDKENELFATCLRAFDGGGSFGVETKSGEYIKMGEWLRLAWSASSYAALATERAEAERQEHSLLFLGALAGAFAANTYPVNPNQSYIAPQIRNGTIVRGHYRTLPNRTCLDNIRGCR